jgi:hypothetical protein
MTDTASFGTMDPNSQHQRWSRWVFGIEASPRKLPSRLSVLDNARRYFAAGFQSTAGRVKCQLLRTPLDVKFARRATYYLLSIDIEGPPAHDPAYQKSVRQDFAKKFVAGGFGFSARLVKFEVQILAGDQQDGRPADQLLVLPTLVVSDPSHL